MAPSFQLATDIGYQDVALFLSKSLAALSLLTWLNFSVKEQKPLTSDDAHHDDLVSKRGLSALLVVARLVQFLSAAAIIMCPGSLLWTPWSVNDLVVVAIGNLSGFLRVWSMRTLGDLFTFEVGIRPRHKLVTGGPYRWVRHPSYTGMVLLCATLLLTTGAIPPLAVAAAALFTFGGLSFRMKNEERVLQQHFGAQYVQYCKRVRWRLAPYVY